MSDQAANPANKKPLHEVLVEFINTSLKILRDCSNPALPQWRTNIKRINFCLDALQLGDIPADVQPALIESLRDAETRCPDNAKMVKQRFSETISLIQP